MSFQQVGSIITLPVAADLSASIFCAVDVNSSGQAALPSAGGAIVGVLTDKVATIGASAAIQVQGIAQMKLGGTVAKGDQVKVDTSGRAVAATAGDVAAGASVGRCILGGAINNIGAVLLTNFGQGLAVGGGALEIVTSGAISVTKNTTLLSVTGTQAYTLGSGLYAGQRKTIQASVAASIPAGTVTGVFLDTDGTTARTTAAFDAVADQLVLEWTGAAWQVLVKTSVTMG